MSRRGPSWGRLERVAMMVAISSVAFASCASTSGRCDAYGAAGRQYCAFTDPEVIARRPPCPDPGRLRIVTPHALICAPPEGGPSVPPELCAVLPNGCDGPEDRRRQTPTDLARLARLSPLGVDYGRCVERVGVIARLSPLRSPALGARETFEATERLRRHFEDVLPRVVTDTRSCCETPRRAEGSLCFTILVHHSVLGRIGLDAAIDAVAHRYVALAGPRPEIHIGAGADQRAL